MRSLRVPTSLVVLVACSATATSAAAERSRARLHYEAPDACPTEALIHEEVQARLGYDPFAPDGTRLVTATIRRAGAQFVATVTMSDANGTTRSREPLVSSASRCDDIAASLVLAVSIAIDPLSLTRTPESAPPPSPPPPPERSPPPESPSLSPFLAAKEDDRSVPPPPAPLEAWVGGAANGTLGLLPAASLGLEASALVQHRSLGLRLGGRYDFPAETDGPVRGSVQASLALGSLGACWHPRPLLACALGGAGVLFGESRGIANPASDRTFYGTVAARLGVELPLLRSLVARIELEGGVPLAPTTLRIGGNDAWTTPSVYGSLSLGLFVKAL
jgi:hypothetical protein